MGSVMEEDNFELDTNEDFFQIVTILETINNAGTDWDDLINLCLLASAYCAQEAEMEPDEYMSIVRSIRVTEDGVYGEA
jgi:hypothetical protein